jgi:hypothetical protein
MGKMMTSGEFRAYGVTTLLRISGAIQAQATAGAGPD